MGLPILLRACVFEALEWKGDGGVLAGIYLFTFSLASFFCEIGDSCWGRWDIDYGIVL